MAEVPPAEAQAPDFGSIGPSGVASAATPRLTYTGHPFPPAGSPKDQDLLGALLRAQAGVTSERAIALKLTQRLGAAGFDPKLAALEAKQPPADASRTAELRTQLRTAWNRVAEIMTSKWLVDPRLGCRQQGVELEVLMGTPPDNPSYSRLPTARAKAKSCLDTELLMLRPLEKANQDLLAVVAEVRSALGLGRGGADGAGGPAESPVPDGRAR